MNTSDFNSQYEMVVSGRLGLAEFLTRIGEFARKNHDFINDLMRKELDAKRYRNLQVAILVGMKSPSNVYTQVLCDILNLRSVPCLLDRKSTRLNSSHRT